MSLWQKLRTAGILAGDEPRLLRLPEPCLRLSSWLGLSHGRIGFWIRKLDYLIFAGVVLLRFSFRRNCLFHAVLGGVYAVLPLLWFRSSHRFIISVTNPNLSQMVGSRKALPLFRKALFRCDRIDALTETIRRQLLREGLPAEKVHVPSGSVVDVDHFRPLQEKKPWVVFAGRWVEEKNPLLFIKVAEQVHRQEPAATFFLLGEGPQQSLIEQALDGHNLRPYVQYGFQQDLAPILGRARIFVSLQRHDNYPSQGLLEAMSCALVPVASDVGLTWRLVDGTTGIRVGFDPGEIATAIVTLLRDPDRCASFGQAARQRVVLEHSERVFRSYLDNLYSLVEHHKPSCASPLVS